MWMSEKLTSQPRQSIAETADVTLWNNGGNEATGSVQNRNFDICTPFGYRYGIPTGRKVAMLTLAEGNTCLGVIDEGEKIQSGEIIISNPFGAVIRLKVDGSLWLNGVTITKKGDIYDAKGDKING